MPLNVGDRADWIALGRDMWTAVEIVGGRFGRDRAQDAIRGLPCDDPASLAARLESSIQLAGSNSHRQLEFDWDR